MLSYDADRLAIAASNGIKMFWRFVVTDAGATTHYWSTQAFTLSGTNYTFKITGFRGVEMRLGLENGILAPTDTEFDVINADGLLSAADFRGQTLRIYCMASDGTTTKNMGDWKFLIDKVEEHYKRLKFTLTDFISSRCRKTFPNTPYASSTWPSNRTPADDMCVPLTYGTAYIPCAPIFHLDDDTVYYLLGEGSDTADYTVSKIHSPVEKNNSEWTDTGSGGSFSLTKYVKVAGGDSYVVLAPIIADANEDGTADAVGVWKGQGEFLLPAPIRFSFADTSALTGPEEVIQDVLERLGVSSGNIDATTFTAAGATYTGWSLAFNGGFFFKRPAELVLANLLILCNSYLLSSTDVELHVFSKTSQMTLDNSKISTKSFTRELRTPSEFDSGFTRYNEAGEPQDRGVNVRVAAKATTTNTSTDVIDNFMVQDSQDVQRAAALHFQRKYLANSDISFKTNYKTLALRPGDVITIDDTLYSETAFDCMIERMFIKHRGGIEFDCVGFSDDLDDWTDLTPTAVTVDEDSDDIGYWNPFQYGDDAPDDSGNTPNGIAGRVRFEQYGAMYTNGKTTYADTTDGFFIGWDATQNAYVINVGGSGSYIKWSGTSLSVRMAAGETFDLYGDLKVYEGGDIRMIAETTNSSQITFEYPSGTVKAFIYYAHAANYLFLLKGQAAGNYTQQIWGDQLWVCGTSDGVDVQGIASIFSDDEFFIYGASDFKVLLNNQQKGYLGGLSPDCLLHVYAGSAGSVTASSSTVIAIERNASAYLGFLVPDDAAGANGYTAGIVVSHPADPATAIFRYNIYDQSWTWTAASTVLMHLDGSNLYPETSAGIGLGTNTNKFGTSYFDGDILVTTGDTVGMSADAKLRFASGYASIVAANFGVNTNTPGCLMHAYDASSGGSINSTAYMCIESDDNAYFQFLTPNNKNQGIMFGDPGSNSVGVFRYNHNTDEMSWKVGGAYELNLSGSMLYPEAAAGLSLGDATYYWNDVSYKTLTDRGCLGWFDDGVELQDGRKVSDIQALKEIKKDLRKKTVYGVPMLDYRSMPKAVYKKASKDGVELPRDENDLPYWVNPATTETVPAQDGAEITALLSIILGAVKEIDARLERVENGN